MWVTCFHWQQTDISTAVAGKTGVPTLAQTHAWHRGQTMDRQYINSGQTVERQWIDNRQTIDRKYVYNVCAICVQCVYRVCTECVQWYNIHAM